MEMQPPPLRPGHGAELPMGTAVCVQALEQRGVTRDKWLSSVEDEGVP